MATLKDIADMAGVSVTAASLVLNDKAMPKRISEKKRNKILLAAKQLAYVPNKQARAMATRKARVVGVISPIAIEKLDAPYKIFYVLGALAGVEERCKAADYHCLFTTCEEVEIENYIKPRVLRDGSIDGVVLMGFSNAPEAVKHLIECRLPIVHIGTNIDAETHVNCIYGDLDDAFLRISQSYVEMGHRKVLLVLPSGPGPLRLAERFMANQSRIPNFQPQIYISPRQIGDVSVDEGRILANRIVHESSPPRAFIVHTRNHLEGLVAQFWEAGWVCPRDYSIITSSSHIQEAPILSQERINLSTYTVPIIEVGRRAGNILLHLLGERLSETITPEYSIVPCEINFRESCAAIDNNIQPKDNHSRDIRRKYHRVALLRRRGCISAQYTTDFHTQEQRL